MKHLYAKLSFFVMMVFAESISFAQEVTTQGTEFWVSFMGNGFKTNPPGYVLTQIMVSSERTCTGTITNPNTNWTQTFDVEANNITLIDIPENQAYNETSIYETPSNKGLMIVTTDTVSVYCTNIAANSFDASYVLPIEALADEYIIQTYEQSSTGSSGIAEYLTSAFLIVATEDNTTIDIIPSTSTLAGSPSGQPITVTLNKGQTYQVRSNRQNGGNRDLSGSRVTSHDSKPIAVFNGNTLTTIPTFNDGYDHIFEQAMPLRSWGKKFIVTQSYSRHRDFVKIVSSADNNVVKINGTVIATLNSCEVYSLEISQNEKSCYIETSEPSGVYLYNTTSKDDGGSNTNGDPSMLWIAPIEQKMTHVTFTTFSGTAALSSSISHHYVNIIVDTDAIENVYFDNSLLPSSSFEPVEGNNAFSFIRKEISHNVHHISCSSGFNAQVYGFGKARGYAYLVGSKAVDIALEQFINLPPESASPCDFFEWHDSTYFTSGHYTDTVTDGLIHYIHHLNIDLVYSPRPKIRCATPNSVVFGDTVAAVTNTEFFAFQYDFSVEDTLGHIDDWEQVEWRISKPSWTVVPIEKEGVSDKRYCRVYVAEPCDEYVELWGKVSNSCDQDSVVFYLKSSFLNLDSHETASSDFNIIPNPNSGEMELQFVNLTGKVSVTIYDMHGIIVDHIETYNELERNALHYNLEHTSSGIYFFVATAKEGTIAKKTIIE